MGIAKKAISFVTGGVGALIGGKVGKIISAVGMIAVGAITGNPGLIMMGIAQGASALQKRPKVSPSTVDRLNATIDPAAPRKIVFGHTAMATDVRYHAYTGTNQEYYEQILAVASHKVQSIDEIWFDTELAWTKAGGAQGRFVGYLTVADKLEGTSANTVAIDSQWGSAQRLTGCAYLHFKFKLTGNTKKAESPFSSSIPTRVTVRGKGALVPDPRLSTSAGGSGSQSMTDQTTWVYATAADSGRNLACQTLFYLLGWKIGGKLAVGLGMPSARIDFASFITGANICDESVAKAGGGTEPRYRGDGIFSESDDPETVLTSLLQAMNGELTDENGKIALRIDYNDLATPVVALTEADIIDGDDWTPTESGQDVNIVRGTFTDPSDGALYQMVDYPQVTLSGADSGSPDGIQRIETFDLPMVQSPAQAQRLAKLRLQRKQYPGIFSARFNMRAWAATYGKPVTLSHSSLGFSAKKFRVAGQRLRTDGTVDLVLKEHETAMYTWSAEEAAIATPAPPTAYDPLNNPVVQHLDVVSDQTQNLDSSGRTTDGFVSAADALSYGKLAAVGEAHDGEAITFPSTLSNVPKVVFGPGGIAPAAGKTVAIRADNLTVSGFTFKATEQSVTTGSTITDTVSQTVTGTSAPDYQINRSNSGAPYDGKYTYNFTVSVPEIAPGEPGMISVGLYALKGGVWTQVGTATYNNGTGTKSVTISPGTIDYNTGAGVYEFGIEKLSGDGSITGFSSVVYTLGSVTETPLTTTTNKIPYQAFLEQ